MGKIEKIINVIDAVNELSGRWVSWLVLLFTGMLGYEVIARYLFNSPTNWAFDLSYMLGGSYFLLGEAYCLLKRQHVRIDIFYSRFSLRKQAWVDLIFTMIFFFPLWGGLLYALVPHVIMSWEIAETTEGGTWLPPLYPFKTVMPVAIFLFILQGIAEFLRSLLVIVKGSTS